MDLNTAGFWLTVFGTILTLVFGVPSVVAFYKRNKYPGRISFVHKSSISLFHSITKKFEEINILYQTSPIDSNIIYLKGALLNDGDIDIKMSRENENIQLILPTNSEWLKVIVTKKSEGVNCNTKINQTELSFEYDLIKKGEYVVFEALLVDRAWNNENIYKKIKLHHRIANTNTNYHYEIHSNKNSSIKSSILGLAMLACMSIAFLFFCLNIDQTNRNMETVSFMASIDQEELINNYIENIKKTDSTMAVILQSDLKEDAELQYRILKEQLDKEESNFKPMIPSVFHEWPTIFVFCLLLLGATFFTISLSKNIFDSKRFKTLNSPFEMEIP